MKDAYKRKAYDLINIITSRTKVLDDGVTGIKPIQPNEARNILKQIDKVGTQLRELVDIS